MKFIKNKQIEGADDRPLMMDIYLPDTSEKTPVVIFAHGFKGFKDWGCWHLIAQSFVNQGFAFVKFNFSHNGMTADALLDFADLEAFGQNTYSKEWADLDHILTWITAEAPQYHIDLQQLTLIGHSRGGGMAIAKAAADNRIKNLVTWAAVPTLAWLWASEAFKTQWKNDGVTYQKNARTGQDMPLYYTLCTDYEANTAIFDLEIAAPKVHQPWLIVHGSADAGVAPSSAEYLHHLQPHSSLKIIAKADHVFGGKHPWHEADLPKESVELVETTIDFIKNANAAPFDLR